MLAVDPQDDFRIIAVSANAPGLLHTFKDARAILGLHIGAAISAAFQAKTLARFESGRLRGAAPWQSTLCRPEIAADLDASVHCHNGLIIIELEQSLQREDLEALEASRQLQESLVDLQESKPDIESLSRVVTHAVRLLMGYERVLVYRFDSDWNGRAIGEDSVLDWNQSLDGLHFPASDIPSQARALYCKNKKRWVADRDSIPVPILIDPASAHRTIDLSFARLRSLSPIHLQYHRNMGVNGSMSLSILNGDRLWGLVVCHHRGPHHPSPGQRIAATVLTDAFSLRVGPSEQADTEQARRADLARLTELFSYMAEADDITLPLTSGNVTIAHLFAATGAAVIEGGKLTLLGITPPEAELRKLCDWLTLRTDRAKLFQTDNLGSLYPGWEAYTAIASGLLGIFLSDDRADMLLWFRPEEAQSISWGGDPGEGNDPAKLMPRKSFERWVDIRHGVARPWRPSEFEMAESLRHNITDVIVRSLRRIGELNDRLRQSQKMEAVGELTGGIAHDFNNFLTGVISSLSLAKKHIDSETRHDCGRHIDRAAAAAERAAALTQRLLTFSRRQTLDPVATGVLQRARGMEELIRGAIGAGISLSITAEPDLWTVLCDGNQLDSALLNLAINARDAMPDGGTSLIEAKNLRLDAADIPPYRDIAAGDYVTIAVNDTGMGMDAETVARVFEPFFTTKPLGAGTGLGLSMVYGFAKQSNGYASIHSKPGLGTTVRLFLPRFSPGEPQDEAGIGLPEASRSAQTVLVVDDDSTIRLLITEVLEELGYTVIAAGTGTEGLRSLQSRPQVDLLITDVGLPGGLNGRQLADAARVQFPGLKILFITGFAEQAVLKSGALEAGMQILTKPFSLAALAQKIKFIS
jgi:light-regulated signal transduction histidine kinase (bacteriophytochrome)